MVRVMGEQVMIFGGSFDPVHNGHLIIARAVAEELHAKRVLLMPTGVNPLKPQGPTSSEHRLAMLNQAIEGNDLFAICDIELHRKPPSYTIDTVDELYSLGIYEKPLSLVVGADMIAELPKWKRAEELLEKIRLVIACRPPWSHESVIQAVEKLQGRLPEKILRNIASGVVHTPLIDISSTDIRRRVSAGLPFENLLPPGVAEYIKTHCLYKN